MKRYFFDKYKKDWYMLPYDKRGEWSQWVDEDEKDENDYDEYKIKEFVNKWSFEKPEEITPEEIIEENLKNFNDFLKESGGKKGI